MEDRLFKTREAAVSAALEYNGGRSLQLLPAADPLHAMWGIGFWRKLTEEERTAACPRTRRGPREPSVRFLWPRFDVPFEAVFKRVPPEELTRIMLAAERDRYAHADDDLKYMLQGCAYDVERRISVVYQTPLGTLRSAARLETLRTWRANFLRQADRDRLGGYAVARDRVTDELTKLIWP